MVPSSWKAGALALVMTGGMIGAACAERWTSPDEIAPPPGLRQETGRGDEPAEAPPTLADRLNDNTVSIISGNPNGGYLGIAYDISAVLDDGEQMRILPIVGRGAVQNVVDILYLRGSTWG